MCFWFYQGLLLSSSSWWCCYCGWFWLLVREEKKRKNKKKKNWYLRWVGVSFYFVFSVFIVCCLFAYVLTSHARIYDMRQRYVLCDFLAVWCVFIFQWIDDGLWGDHNAALLGRGSICTVHESTGDVFEIEWPIMF